MNKTYYLRVMRIVIFLLTFGFLHLSAASYSQKVSLSVRETTLKKVLQAIEEQTGYEISVSSSVLSTARTVSIDARQMPLADFLAAIFKDQPIDYEMGKKSIMLSKKEKTILDHIRDAIGRNGEGDVQTSQSTGKALQQLLAGRVTDSLGTPLENATIRIKGTNRATFTNTNGEFTLRDVENGSILQISFLGYSTREITVSGPIGTVILSRTNAELEEAEVILNTGYQTLPKERATGSFSFVDNKTLNRIVGPNILSRLEDVTSGLLFEPHIGISYGTTSATNISIRGRSTIHSNTDPLIVLDNFPYDGDINNINPNTILSVTVLKDAAAASIWGAKAANGVIVITSKKGQYNQPLNVAFNTNIKIGNKPNLFYSPILSSSDYIDIEKYLFDNGNYDYQIGDMYNIYPFTPAVNAMIDNRNGLITTEQLQEKLNVLKTQDVRNDISKYVYQQSVAQQYSLNISGGNNTDNYFLSGGYDKGFSNVKGLSNDRITLNFNNTYSIIKGKLEFQAGFNFTKTKLKNNIGDGTSPAFSNMGTIYPYAQLADANGNALAIPRYISPLIDTIGHGQLLDWSYKFLDEQKYANNVTRNTDYKLNFSLNCNITRHIKTNLNYQYSKGDMVNDNLHSLDSYYTRDYINQFSIIDNSSNTVTRPVPLGAILDKSSSLYTGQHGRFQINYDQEFGEHQVTAIAGAEINDVSTNGQTGRFYGYDEKHSAITPVDYISNFTNILSGYGMQIQNNDNLTIYSDRFVSYFGNLAYTYLGRYTLSLSGRKDGANIFGVNANQKIKPFWSMGLAWNVSQEPHYSLSWLPLLKLRTTYGYNGNVNRGISALLTTALNGVNLYNQLESYIANAPNPDLRWETSKQLNIGIDFSILKSNRIFGSIDYYHKNGINLIGDAILPPTSGFTSFRGNTADMRGEGIDLILNGKILDKQFKWLTTLQYSTATNIVTNYKVSPPTNGYIIQGNLPVVGYPVGAVFAYKWAGLDPENGDPQGYVDGKISKDYALMQASTNKEDLVYKGSQLPTAFGNFMNTFTFKQLSLSVNISYKFGYYFGRPSISYGGVFSGSTLGSADYEKRWQKPGDEKFTNVPSMIYPYDSSRDHIYSHSEVLIDKGDQIRLKDIRLSYDLTKIQMHRFPFSHVQFYAVAENIGLIWRANHDHFDPDNINTFPIPLAISAGLNLNF
ncbi:TonB-linked outer membrane protein, SusC/RagA family [bacterium A37T11]|nr:TonB-linked outer membrane protein, SusC/RagA family [bacterium A37T11]